MLYTPDHFFDADADEQVAKPNWQDSLTWGDIVTFYFPVKEENGPPSKRRPCLVVDAFVKDDQCYVTLVYGTSTERRGLRNYEVQDYSSDDVTRSGLTRPTRFLCSRRISVSTQHPGFISTKKRGTPVLGHLSGSALNRLATVRARIDADADIGVSLRAERTRKGFYLQRS